MTDPKPPAAPNPATTAMAELVARRKAAQAAKGGARDDLRGAERAAAARATALSKPAMRK